MQSELSTTFLNALPNPVFVKDHELRYVWVNSAFEQLYSLTADDVIGKNDDEVFADSGSAPSPYIGQHVSESGSHASESIVVIDGQQHRVLTATCSSNEDDAVYVVSMLYDLTQSTDPLTDCLTRSLFFSRWDNLAESPEGYGVLIVDTDHLKMLNDIHGHDVGDAVLVRIAEALHEGLSPGDLVSRFGGAQFVVALPNSDPRTTAEIASVVSQTVAELSIAAPGEALKVSVSVGVGHATSTNREDLERALQSADRDLFTKKQQLRDQILADA